MKSELELQPKEMGIVYFDSSPRGARIFVDGQLLIDPDTEESLKTPERVLLVEGRRDFTFVLEGHKDVSGYVDVFPGVTVNIFRNMEPGKSEEGWEEPEPQIFLTNQNTGILRVYSFPDGADTYVNGRHIGKAPLVVTDVPAGEVNVAWEMPGMMNEEKIVDIMEGTLSDIYITMIALPKLQSYLYEEKTMNEVTNINKMQEPYYPVSPDIPCVFPETPGETATQGSIVMTTYPPGGSIIMDGKTVIDLDTGEPITTPVQLVLTIGYHDFVFQLEGYFDEYAGEYITPAHISYVNRNFNVC